MQIYYYLEVFHRGLKQANTRHEDFRLLKSIWNSCTKWVTAKGSSWLEKCLFIVCSHSFHKQSTWHKNHYVQIWHYNFCYNKTAVWFPKTTYRHPESIFNCKLIRQERICCRYQNRTSSSAVAVKNCSPRHKPPEINLDFHSRWLPPTNLHRRPESSTINEVSS